MALLRLQNEADCLTSQLTKQSLKHQPSPPPPNRSYPYRASGLVLGSRLDYRRSGFSVYLQLA
jgi:hypothetical protein